MAKKMGKTPEEIKALAEKRKSLLEKGNITNQYGDLLINVAPGDVEKVDKNSNETIEKLLEKAKDKIVELDIESLSPSPNNHFSQISGEKREEMLGSLRSFGQINPIIVRPKECVQHYQDMIVNDFEILVGHTRVSLMKEIGESSVKAILVDCDDVKATLLINQSNIQRTKVSDIELARAYKATYDAMKKDKDSNLTAGNYKNGNVEISTMLSKRQSGTSKRTDEEVAKRYGISARTLQRKMALADCSDGIVKQYNRGLITQEQVQTLSKLPDDVQEQVADVLKDGNVMTKDIAENLLDVYNEVMKDPPLRASFPLNAIRSAIKEGQPKKEEKKSDGKGKVKSTRFNISDDLFPKEVKQVDRNKYVEAALKYILEHKISFDL